jgi:pimeloyl-ACP methyl ester carboxylesterase
MPPEPEAAALARTRLVWAMGSTGKFIWPIPDKGLKKRIHRLAATPALLVWGEDDRLVPLAYADEFRRRLPRARLEVVKGAGHAPDLEQPEMTAQLVQSFLKT